MNLKKFFFNTVTISVLFIASLSPVLAAEAPITPAKMDAIVFVPFKKVLQQVQQSFINQTLSFEENLPAYQLQTADGQIQVVSDRVDLTADVQTKNVQNLENQNLGLSMTLQKAVASAKNIHLLVTVRKDLGFGWATLRLNMQCQEVRISLANQNPIQSNIVIQQAVATVSQIEWDLSSTAISTELVGCTEVAGFDSELKNQIKSFIQQSFALDTLKNLINTKLNAALNIKIQSELTKMLATYNVLPEQKHIIDELSNLWVFSNDTVATTFQQNEIAQLSQSKVPAMLVKKASIEDLVKKRMNDYLLQNSISSKVLSGLEQLTCSRWVQFFVWPALRSLGKCFEMKVQNRIESVQIDNLNNLEMQLKLSSWASGDGHQLAYFKSGVRVYPLTPEAQITSLSAQQDTAFTKWSGRSSWISTGMMQSALQGLLGTTVKDLSQKDLFGFFKKKTSIQKISSDAVLLKLN